MFTLLVSCIIGQVIEAAPSGGPAAARGDWLVRVLPGSEGKSSRGRNNSMSNCMILDQLLTLKEAAKRLRISVKLAYRWFHSGKLKGPAYQPYRVWSSSVDSLLNTPHVAEKAATTAQPVRPEPQARKVPKKRYGMQTLPFAVS